MISIENIDDCKKAVIALGIECKKHSDCKKQTCKKPCDTTEGSNEPGYPKGCYQSMEGTFKVYFNSHSSGSSHKKAAPICTNG